MSHSKTFRMVAQALEPEDMETGAGPLFEYGPVPVSPSGDQAPFPQGGPVCS